MERLIFSSKHEIAEEARKWVGYLEHKDRHFLGLYDANVGKGNHTAFAEIVRQEGGRNLQGLPWCAVFVYAVYLRVLGKHDTKAVIGRPHARARNLAWAVKRRKLWADYLRDASVGDIVFLSNDGKHIDHCGIIVEIDGQNFVSIEGNARDDTGHFAPSDGGVVAMRKRHCCDAAIMGYGVVTRRFVDGNGLQ